jgi:tRNA nucleotidyltransferase/poly(A) polymerase
LLGKAPKDYDVATSATPEQVRQIFGARRTIPVGAAFGVITVIGNKTTGNVEVATFRSDGKYSDGRHPDQVTFSDPEHDAQRRDFTINGLFYDPVRGQVRDYVGGQADLQRQIVRAIRNPRERFEEDHLRMLRAIRFATVLNFELDGETRAAIQVLAEEIRTVSGERIAAEMRRMLESPQRGRGLELLWASGLMGILFPPLPRSPAEGTRSMASEPPLQQPTLSEQPSKPEPENIAPENVEPENVVPENIVPDVHEQRRRWAEDFRDACQRLSELPPRREGLEISLAVLTLTELLQRLTGDTARRSHFASLAANEASSLLRDFAARMQAVVHAWRLSNESKTIFKTIQHSLPVLARAGDLPWSRLQPVLLLPQIEVALDTADVLAASGWMDRSSLARARDCLHWPLERLNPAPLLTGDQLRQAGFCAGPELGRLLAELRQKQLDGELTDSDSARDWALGQRR